jgi:type II secretory pathway pseudopilin PulG
MIIVVAITGLIVTILGLVVQQIVSVPEKSSDQVEALHSVQNIIDWVGTDGQEAASAVGSSYGLNITLPDTTVIRYARVGTTVNRYHDGLTTLIAEDISSMNFTIISRVIYMSVVAAPDSRWGISKSQTYRIAMRPSGT